MSLTDIHYLDTGKNLIGVEVGVYHGGNARRMLEGLDIKLLHLVDPYKEYMAEESFKYVSQTSMDNAKAAAFKELEGLEDRIRWHFVPSVEAAKSIKDKSVDFVYLDGDHAYEAVKADIKAWTPKIKKGGILSGDDYKTISVRFAVDELLEVETVQGIEWWIRI